MVVLSLFLFGAMSAPDVTYDGLNLKIKNQP
jgi:hypothetical protein